MSGTVIMYVCALLLGVLISSVSQVLLKKAALQPHASVWGEYVNARVIIAYMLFFIATFLSLLAYKGIALSLGQMLETTGYLYITLFGVMLFGEKLNYRKGIALICIIVGVIVYAFA